MQTPTKRTSHRVYNLNYHLVFVTKYRQCVLTGRIADHLKTTIPVVCTRYGWEQLALEVIPDHVHLFLSAPPTTAPMVIGKTVKSILAVDGFRTFPTLKRRYFWGSGLWTDGCREPTGCWFGWYGVSPHDCDGHRQPKGSLTMTTLTRCYTYRLYPTDDQHTTLVRWAGCRRYVWNWALRQRKDHYRATGQGLGYAKLAAALTQLKRDPAHVWLRECIAQVLQQTLMDLERAFTNCFEKRAKYPRFKARKTTPHSLRFPQCVLVVDAHTISVPKIGLMRAVIHRPLVGITKGATIKQDATGAWWVVFVCHSDRPDTTPTADRPVGIDVGLESFTTLHTGAKTAPPKFYRRAHKKLARAQRNLSRAQKGSNNHKKARQRVAKIHQKIKNQRTDWLHKHALGIIQNHDTVCIEDLNVRGLARTKRGTLWVKSFMDAALSTFMQMLREKAEWHGRQVVQIGRFYASSKTCHACHSKTALTLSDRVWTCPTCGTTHDRDVNAAINILHEGVLGTTESQNAAGDPGSPAKRRRVGR